MTQSTEALTYRDFLKAVREDKDGRWPDWLRQSREAAYERFQTLDFPSRKTEAWRYVNLEPVLNHPYHLPKVGAETLVPTEMKKYEIAGPNALRLAFVNGIFSEKLSTHKNLPAGILLEPLSLAVQKSHPALKDHLSRIDETEGNIFALSNQFSFEDGVFLEVDENTVIDRPIQLLFLGEGNSVASSPRIIISLKRNAQASVLLHTDSLPLRQYFINALAEVELEQNAILHCVNFQSESSSAFNFLTVRAALHQASRLHWISVSRGGAVIRNDIHVEYEGEGASCKLDGLAVLSNESRVYNYVTVRHKQARGTSRQVFKNILAEKSQAEYSSIVHVLRDAIECDTDQLDRNLLLSRDARAFTRPQLKIDTDNVKSTHGAATGQWVGEELFYLRSRGLTEKLAKFVLTHGYAREIIEKIEIPALRHAIDREIHLELDHILENQ